jgi:hypothetical protein
MDSCGSILLSHYIQVLVGAVPWEFKSPSRHHLKRPLKSALNKLGTAMSRAIRAFQISPIFPRKYPLFPPRAEDLRKIFSKRPIQKGVESHEQTGI